MFMRIARLASICSQVRPTVPPHRTLGVCLSAPDARALSSSSPAGPVAARETREGDWVCEACGGITFGFRTKCFTCHRPRHPHLVGGGDGGTDGAGAVSVDGNLDAPKIRVRQHVNPLASTYQQPMDLAAGWVGTLFADPSLPFHVDVGCARGAFCMDLAASQPAGQGLNVLGLEIRRPVAAHCAENARKSGLGNVGFLACNANVDLGRVLDGIAEAGSRVARVSVQFPDPHWKAKHQKRRVVQPALIEAIAARTDEACDIFLQSDIEEVAREMRERFGAHPAFQDTVADPDAWVDPNPTGIATEREVATFAKDLPVFRALLVKKKTEA